MLNVYFQSNVTIEHHQNLISNYLNAKVHFSDYDNVMNDTAKIQETNSEYVVILDFLDNIVEDFEFEILSNRAKFEDVKSMYLQKIRLLADALDEKTTIFFCHLFPFISLNGQSTETRELLELVENLNDEINKF